MRPDLIGEGYASALAELQDNVPPFDTATAYGIIESELGAPVTALFSSITPQPIASASLGQVRIGAGWGFAMFTIFVRCTLSSITAASNCCSNPPSSLPSPAAGVPRHAGQRRHRRGGQGESWLQAGQVCRAGQGSASVEQAPCALQV